MKAKMENIVNHNRNRLEEVIPLDMPYALGIDPCNLCNFRCKFCAMQTSSEKQSFKKQFMPLSLFEKIINDIKQFSGKLKVLRLAGQGEPLLNPEYIAMIEYASKSRIADYIETVTNGSKLNPIYNQKLVDSGINRIRISIEAVDEVGYNKMAGVKLDFSEFVSNIRDLYDKSRGKCEIYIKTVDAAVNTEEKKEQFYHVFGDICDRIFVDRVIPLWSDFEQLLSEFEMNDEGMHGQKLQKIEVCPYSFYNLLINPDGDVTVCCADWKRKLVVGNVAKENFVDIWSGEKLRDFWKDMLSKKKNKYEMCQKCVLPMYDCNDNIDEYAEEILRRF